MGPTRNNRLEVEADARQHQQPQKTKQNCPVLLQLRFNLSLEFDKPPVVTFLDTVDCILSVADIPIFKTEPRGSRVRSKGTSEKCEVADCQHSRDYDQASN